VSSPPPNRPGVTPDEPEPPRWRWRGSGEADQRAGNLADLQQRLFDPERRYETAARPYEWNFTQDDLTQLMKRIAEHEPSHRRMNTWIELPCQST